MSGPDPCLFYNYTTFPLEREGLFRLPLPSRRLSDAFFPRPVLFLFDPTAIIYMKEWLSQGGMR